jgi:hypothetical protein
MGSKNANVNDLNGCTMVRTGMLRWLEPRNRNRPCRNGRLPRKNGASATVPTTDQRHPPVVDLFLWTSNSPPYPPPQSEKPPLPPPSVGKTVFRGAGKRPFSWEGRSRWGFGPDVFEARTESAQTEGRAFPPLPPPLGCGHSNLSGYLSLGGGCRKTPRIDS